MKRPVSMMKFAIDLAQQSKCTERQVAAVITDADMSQVLSIGINGGAKKLQDCLCVVDGKYGCIHAEINALIKCSSSDPGQRMFITLAPCKQCAAAIINAPGKITTVYYREAWKEDTGIKMLAEAGIGVIQL